MRSVHLIIPDLFLPADIAAEAVQGLALPALERMLARGVSKGALALTPSTSSGRTDVLRVSLESHLCELFGVPCKPDAPIAPVSAAFDGLGDGCWLRADPVHLRLQRDQLVLLPEVEISADEAVQMCASLNRHFAGESVEFFAPHPQRWYMRLDRLPDIEAVPLSQAIGRNVRDLLPKGKEAVRWHRIFNEIQMLLYAHPVNEAREARGEPPVNSVWFWGGGCGPVEPSKKAGENLLAGHPYVSVSSDEVLAEMFASAACMPFEKWLGQWSGKETNGEQLLIWTGLRAALQRGDLSAWREALQSFETGYAQPLWKALCSGKIGRLRVDVVGENGIRRMLLARSDTWAFWKRIKPLSEYF